MCVCCVQYSVHYKRVMFYFFFVLYLLLLLLCYILYIYIPILCTKLNSYKEDQFTLIIFMYQYFIFKKDKQKRQHNVSCKHNHTFNEKKNKLNKKMYLLNTVICLISSCESSIAWILAIFSHHHCHYQIENVYRTLFSTWVHMCNNHHYHRTV